MVLLYPDIDTNILDGFRDAHYFCGMARFVSIGSGVPAGFAEDVTIAERIKHLILPAITLSSVGVSSVALTYAPKVD